MFVWLWSILKTYNQGTNNLPMYNPQIPTGNSVSYGENAYLSYQDYTGLDDPELKIMCLFYDVVYQKYYDQNGIVYDSSTSPQLNKHTKMVK